jgi:hypothetical protein
VTALQEPEMATAADALIDAVTKAVDAAGCGEDDWAVIDHLV